MLKIMTATLCLLGGLCAANADEVVVHPGPDAAVVTPDGPRDGDAKTVVREHDSATGCASKTVHKEDGEGDSKTVSKTNC